MILNILAGLISFVFVLFALVGGITVIHWVKQLGKHGLDSSNVFNPVRLWWFVIKHPERFAASHPWLTRDEWENVNG